MVPPSRVRARAREVQPPHRAPVPSIPANGPQPEQLRDVQLEVHHVAPGEAQLALQPVLAHAAQPSAGTSRPPAAYVIMAIGFPGLHHYS
jgi:hypothetical protein